MLYVTQEDGSCHMENVALRARVVLGRTLIDFDTPVQIRRQESEPERAGT